MRSRHPWSGLDVHVRVRTGLLGVATGRALCVDWYSRVLGSWPAAAGSLSTPLCLYIYRRAASGLPWLEEPVLVVQRGCDVFVHPDEICGVIDAPTPCPV